MPEVAADKHLAVLCFWIPGVSSAGPATSIWRDLKPCCCQQEAAIQLLLQWTAQPVRQRRDVATRLLWAMLAAAAIWGRRASIPWLPQLYRTLQGCTTLV